MANPLEQLVAPLRQVPPVLREKLWELRQMSEALLERERVLEERQAALVQAAAARFQAITAYRPDDEAAAAAGNDSYARELFDETELAAVRKERAAMLEMQDQKIARTTEIYEMLDACCARADKEIRELQRVVPDFARASASGSRKNKAASQQLGAFAAAGGLEGLDEDGAPSMLGGVSVDPNEPTYCFCRRVAYGVMVGCENEHCKYEWFHLDCIGLRESPPVGEEWYCPECRLARKS